MITSLSEFECHGIPMQNMNEMWKTIVLSILAFALMGCQSISDVVPTGQGSYLVGAVVHGGMQSDAEVTALSIKRGREFCSALGKSFELINASNAGTQGWTPQQSQIMFRCV